VEKAVEKQGILAEKIKREREKKTLLTTPVKRERENHPLKVNFLARKSTYPLKGVR
jgi:hypothetical protein